MANTKIRLIMFFAIKDGEAKQDWELAVAQIMNSLLPNSDLNWRSSENHYTIPVMTWIKSTMITQWKWEIDLRD